MIRHAHNTLLQRLLAAPVAAFVLALALPSAALRAQDVEEPAGELPDEDGGGAGADAEPPVEPMDGDTPGGGDEGGDDKKKKDEKSDDEARPADTWESYEGKGVAEEITGGVRVEDIVEPPTEYRYAAFGKPDPFVPPMITEQDPAKAAPPGNLEIPIVSPLQRFPLDQLKLVGVWQLTSGERKALIMTREGGAGIIIKNGDPIGNRGGKILAIGDEFLTVREFMLAEDGTRQFEDRQMFMGTRDDDDVAGKVRFEPGKKETKVILDRQNDVEGVGTPVAPPPKAGAAREEIDLKQKNAAPVPKPADAPVNAAAAGNAKAGVGVDAAAANAPAAPAAATPAAVPANGAQTPAALPGGVPGDIPTLGAPAGGATDDLANPP